MTSLHVLFVDDEQAILDGLRNSLRKERKRWDMTFALGGQQALEHMKQTPADVVITDMRRPGRTRIHHARAAGHPSVPAQALRRRYVARGHRADPCTAQAHAESRVDRVGRQ